MRDLKKNSLLRTSLKRVILLVGCETWFPFAQETLRLRTKERIEEIWGKRGRMKARKGEEGKDEEKVKEDENEKE